MNINQKVKTRIQQMSLDIFLNQTLLKLIDYLFQFIKKKRLLLKDLNLKGTTKGIINNYNVIISRKNFYDQPVDSDIKRYEEIKKLATGQGEITLLKVYQIIII